MNYIYDIVLNFQDNYYQFFEWNRKDKIKNISKIAVYRVDDDDLLDLTYNDVIVDNIFLNDLKEANKKYKKIMCLVSNTNQTIGLLFNEEGKIIKRSSLLFEEETEVNYFAKELPTTKINYIENTKKIKNNSLRLEIEKKSKLIKFISNIDNPILLKYLYYEYFKEECNNTSKIKNTLLKIVEEEWNINKNKLYSLIDILTKKDLLTK